MWTCQRVTNRRKCGAENVGRAKKCAVCGKLRPKRKYPAHHAAFATLTYEQCVEKWGEQCGICGRPPKPGKKLHRDHEHKGEGRIRGLLCFPCNAALRVYMTIEWLQAAIAYLKREDA